MTSDSSVVARVRETLVADGPPRGSRVLVAVSGRLASVALLDILHQLAPEFQLFLHIGHLRAREDGEHEAAYAVVKDLAARLRLPLRSARVPGREASPDPSAGETPLESLRRETGASVIATGHTADDLAVELLLNLVRLEDAGQLLRPPPAFLWPLRVVTADALRSYIVQRRLPWRAPRDALQLATSAQCLKTMVLPLLARQVETRSTERLAAAARRIAEDRGVLDALALAARAELGWSPVPDGLSIAYDRWQTLPRALRRRVLADAVASVTGPAASPWEDADHLASRAARLADGDTVLAHQLKIQRSGGILRITTSEGLRD